MWVLVNIGSGNGLVPLWHQAITWTNADLIVNKTFENLHEILIAMLISSLKKINKKMSSAK